MTWHARWNRRRALMSRSANVNPSMMKQYILDSCTEQQFDLLFHSLNETLAWCEQKIALKFENHV